MTRCPKCDSDDISEEDDMLANALLLGIPVAMNTDYTCNKCGHTWSD